MAVTIRSGSDEQLNAMTREDPARPDTSAHSRFAPSSGRSPSTTMTSAGSARGSRGTDRGTCSVPQTVMSSSSARRTASASAKMRSWSAIRTLITISVTSSAEAGKHHVTLGDARIRTAAGDGRALEPAVRAQLGQNVLDVAAQGADGNVHLAGHLPGALARDDPAQHFGLAGRERAQRLMPARRGGAARRERGLRVKSDAAPGHYVQGGRDGNGALVLAEEA